MYLIPVLEGEEVSSWSSRSLRISIQGSERDSVEGQDKKEVNGVDRVRSVDWNPLLSISSNMLSDEKLERIIRRVRGQLYGCVLEHEYVVAKATAAGGGGGGNSLCSK